MRILTATFLLANLGCGTMNITLIDGPNDGGRAVDATSTGDATSFGVDAGSDAGGALSDAGSASDAESAIGDAAAQETGATISGDCQTVVTTATPCSSVPSMPNPDAEVIDGIGTEFCTLPALSFDVQTMPVTLPSPAPAIVGTGLLWVAWSPMYLHAFVHVMEPKVVSSTTSDISAGDAVEFFIAPPATTPYSGQYSSSPSIGPLQLVLSAPPSQGMQPRSQIRLSNAGTATDTPSADFAGRAVSDGYEIELRVPWGNVTDAPASGKSIAFDFATDLATSHGGGQPPSLGLQGLLADTSLTSSPFCVDAGVSPTGPSCDTRTWCTPSLE